MQISRNWAVSRRTQFSLRELLDHLRFPLEEMPVQTDRSAELGVPIGPHPQFGTLLFDQKYPVLPGIAALVFGGILLLVGVWSFSTFNGNPKALIAGLGGLGVGAVSIITGIHFLLVKIHMSYHFYQRGLVYRNRSMVTEAAYSEVARFSINQSQSGGKMPGTFFNMHFSTRDGKNIEYQLGVDQGDVNRMARAKKLIKHIQASVPGGASK